MDSMLIAAGWLAPAYWWAIAQVVIGLGAVIFVHELGHFLVAKAVGVKCEKFYVGFDFFDIRIGDRVIIPRALVKWQWGETEYGVGIVPLGGYVKMLGQDDNPGNIEKEIERSRQSGETSDDVELETAGMIDRSQMDPRSYLAKSVPQRMAIISAGVIFNLIFAVIFAAIAFRTGVDYEPPVVGNVVAGGPAWQADLVGARILRIGDKRTDGYFTYLHMAEEIAFSGGEPIEIELIKPGMNAPQTVTLAARDGLRPEMPLPMIGVTPEMLPKVGSGDPILPGTPAEKAQPPFEPGDLIVQINDTPVKIGYDLRSYLARNFDRELDFIVERGEQKERVTIHVGTNPRRDLGFTVRWGAVVGIQNGSPAETAGFQVGDQIRTIDGTDPGDLMTLEERMTRIARDEPRTIPFEVLRGDETITLQVEPRLPRVLPSLDPGRPVAIDSLGLAIEIVDEIGISSVPGIESGDSPSSLEILFSDEQKSRSSYIERGLIKKSKYDLVSENLGWQGLYTLIQSIEPGVRYRLGLNEHDDDREDKSIEFVANASTEYFLPTRGILLSPYQENYRSPTWTDAMKLGAYQTWFDAGRVWRFLTKLVRGQISPTNLGGPGTIAVVATSEASQGTSRLLLFLTLLSANLAIVNFLPIPVLDGGHMLFLLYEGIFRRPVNEHTQIILTYIGLFLILGLMLFVIFLDVGRLSNLF